MKLPEEVKELKVKVLLELKVKVLLELKVKLLELYENM